MKPIGLTNEQLLTIQRAASPLHPHDRGPFLERVAEMLNGHEIGDGLVGRVVREASISSSGCRSLSQRRCRRAGTATRRGSIRCRGAPSRSRHVVLDRRAAAAATRALGAAYARAGEFHRLRAEAARAAYHPRPP
jgi:hypothetical protein